MKDQPRNTPVSEDSHARRLDRRALAQDVARHAEHLRPAERALAKAFFDDGRSATEIARLAGVRERSIHRRLSALARRLNSPRFRFILNYRPALTPTRARVATACILRGLSMRRAARDLNLPEHVVRTHMLAIEAMFERSSL